MVEHYVTAEEEVKHYVTVEEEVGLDDDHHEKEVVVPAFSQAVELLSQFHHVALQTHK